MSQPCFVTLLSGLSAVFSAKETAIYTLGCCLYLYHATILVSSHILLNIYQKDVGQKVK